MVAPSLPDQPDGDFPVRSAAPAHAGEENEAAVTDLAAHWAALASPIHAARPGLAVRLAALLRRLAAACRDEQFWALRARVRPNEPGSRCRADRAGWGRPSRRHLLIPPGRARRRPG